jgi:hypothetical protein
MYIYVSYHEGVCAKAEPSKQASWKESGNAMQMSCR